MSVAIINYGAGNIKSLEFALNRLGVTPVVTANPEKILQSNFVIFPGVGHADYALKKLKETELDVVIPTLTQPVLGICLGMQLMCNYTEESNTEGLKIFNTNVKKFSPEVKSPHMGWNTITFKSKENLFKKIANNNYMYFVHNYYAEPCQHTIASTKYNVLYSAALNKNNFYGVQFHPEKSGKVGEQLLRNFLNL